MSSTVLTMQRCIACGIWLPTVRRRYCTNTAACQLRQHKRATVSVLARLPLARLRRAVPVVSGLLLAAVLADCQHAPAPARSTPLARALQHCRIERGLQTGPELTECLRTMLAPPIPRATP